MNTTGNTLKSATRKRGPRRMTGSIRRLPSGRYQVRYLDPTGERQTAPETFTTKREADDWLAANRADIVRGVYRSPDLGSETVADYMTRWLADRTDLRPSTRQAYTHALRHWIDRPVTGDTIAGRSQTVHLGALPLNVLTLPIVRQWYAAAAVTQKREAAARARRARTTHPARAWAQAHGLDVAATGRISPDVLTAWREAGAPGHTAAAPAVAERDDRPARIVQYAYQTLRAALNTAVDDGLILTNPCRIKRAVSTDLRPLAIPSPTEVAALAEHMPPRFAAAVTLAAWTGLRGGEVFALRRRDVNLDARTVSVSRGLIDLKADGLVIGPPKTESSRRTVHLPASVATTMAEHLTQHVPADLDALIFATDDGHPIDRTTRSRMFARARSAIGRPDLTFHDLRHTAATLAAQSGASVRDVQYRLGHSTVSAAMRYQHASADRDREIADRLDRLASTPNDPPPAPTEPAVPENIVSLDARRRHDRTPGRAAGSPSTAADA